MVSTTAGALLNRLRRTLAPHADAAATDAWLLARFRAGREEGAFEALVRRHGSMVFGVCRRILGNEQDAEDAFQATFLVLARKADSVRPASAVGRWLHGVAYHTALKAREAAARRRAHEKHACPRPVPATANDSFEVRAILDQELSRLPNDYRAAVVLCDLEGLTRHDAAVHLGWPEGTVAGRLARARELLAGRLTQRGVTLSAGGLATALAAETASAAPSSTMVTAALQAALTSKTPAAVATLANSVLRASFATRIATAALLLVVLGLGGAGWYFHGANAADAPKASADSAAGAKNQPLAAQAKKPGAVFKAPGSGTLDVALSPDGKILARAGTGTTELWDVASGKKLHTLKGQPHFYKVAFSPDGKTFASGSGDVAADKFEVAVKLWDVATGKERVLGKGQPIRAVSMAFSPDSKTLATSYFDPAAVKLWDVATGKEKLELGGAWGSLAFSPDGTTLAVGDKSVHLWDLTTGKKRGSLARREDWVDLRPLATSDVLGFSPDGQTLVSAGLHKGKEGHSAQLTLWDVATAKKRATIVIPGFSAPNAPPLVFTSDGKTLITAVWIFDDDNNSNGRLSVEHWDLATGKARATFWTPVHPGGDPALEASNVAGFYFAALSADGKTVAWGGAEGDGKITGTAHVWEVQSLATSPPKIPKELEEAQEAERAAKQESEALRGTWKLRAVETGGRRKDPKHLQTEMRLGIGELYLDTPDGHQFAFYRTDASRRPKTIDIDAPGYFNRGKFSGRKSTVKAIYLLEGDRLTICSNAIDTEARPTEFKTQPDDGLTLEIYERFTEREQRDAEREKAEGTFSLQMPAQATFVKPGEKKSVTLGIRRGKRFEEDVGLTFTDVPKGVTFVPAKPVSKHPSPEVEFTIQAARDAAVGDFAIKVTGGTANGHASGNQFDLSVDPAGEAAREQPGKPPRRYLRPSRDPYTGGFDFSMAADETAHDGEVITSAGGKLVMKSKDGTEHSYTLADNPQITLTNARSSLEQLEELKAGLIVRVTAKKAKPQEATRIEAAGAYGALMAEYAEWSRQKGEPERQKKEQQEIERQKKVQQDIDHLQGTWLVVSSQSGDEKEPLESLKKKRVIIKGDHLTLASGNERNEKRAGTIKIDPQAKSLDWVIPMAGDTAMKALYELKGDDLKIGFGVDGLLRPTRFEMGKDQVGWLLVLKRERPSKHSLNAK